MPLRDVQCINKDCPDDEKIREEIVKLGETVLCSQCGKAMWILETFKSNFVLKGSWPGQDLKRDK